MDFEEKIREDRQSLIEDIKRLVSINSVEAEPEEGMPFGKGPAQALGCFLSMAEEMGFQTENFDNYAGHIDFGEGEEVLGILGHMDVVPCGDGEFFPDRLFTIFFCIGIHIQDQQTHKAARLWNDSLQGARLRSGPAVLQLVKDPAGGSVCSHQDRIGQGVALSLIHI